MYIFKGFILIAITCVCSTMTNVVFQPIVGELNLLQITKLSPRTAFSFTVILSSVKEKKNTGVEERKDESKSLQSYIYTIGMKSSLMRSRVHCWGRDYQTQDLHDLDLVRRPNPLRSQTQHNALVHNELQSVFIRYFCYPTETISVFL